jgi:hypothetical protein
VAEHLPKFQPPEDLALCYTGNFDDMITFCFMNLMHLFLGINWINGVMLDMTTSAHPGFLDSINAQTALHSWAWAMVGSRSGAQAPPHGFFVPFPIYGSPQELLRQLGGAPEISPDTLGRHSPVRKRRLGNLMAAAARNIALGNNTFYLLNDFSEDEDIFWGLIAPKSFSWFKVASVDGARKFSFECNPRKLFELNANQLPFGCHAWQKYDPEFVTIHITRNVKGQERLL